MYRKTYKVTKEKIKNFNKIIENKIKFCIKFLK